MWFILSLISGISFAANRLLIRSVFTKNGNPMAFGAVHEVLAGLLLLPIGLFYFSLPQSPQTWLIGGYVFLNERNHMKQKIIGSVLIAAGIVLLYVIR